MRCPRRSRPRPAARRGVAFYIPSRGGWAAVVPHTRARGGVGTCQMACRVHSRHLPPPPSPRAFAGRGGCPPGAHLRAELSRPARDPAPAPPPPPRAFNGAADSRPRWPVRSDRAATCAAAEGGRGGEVGGAARRGRGGEGEDPSRDRRLQPAEVGSRGGGGAAVGAAAGGGAAAVAVPVVARPRRRRARARHFRSDAAATIQSPAACRSPPYSDTPHAAAAVGGPISCGCRAKRKPEATNDEGGGGGSAHPAGSTPTRGFFSGWCSPPVSAIRRIKLHSDGQP